MPVYSEPLQAERPGGHPGAMPPAGTPEGGACPFHNDQREAKSGKQKTLVLTGASRGIGHATGKLFSDAGWRIITCSRQPFADDRCPWATGVENHVAVELTDHRAVPRAIDELKEKLDGATAARADQQRGDLAEERRRRAADLAEHPGRDLDERVSRQSARPGLDGAGFVRRVAQKALARSSTSPRSSARACIRSPAAPMRRRKRP